MIRWAARALWSAAMGLLIAAVGLELASRAADFELGDAALAFLVIATFASVGAIVASRRPHNAVGWVLSAMGLLFAIAFSLHAYVTFGLEPRSVTVPGIALAAWVGNWIWPVALVPIGFVLLLFPGGSLPSRRWRVAAATLGAGLVSWFVSQAFAPGPLMNYPSVPNPVGIAGFRSAVGPLTAVSGLLMLAGFAASVVAIVFRFRRSEGIERSQLKWLAYAGALVAVAAAVSLTTEGLGAGDDPLLQFLQQLLVLTISAVPLAAGIAILRYRLYDIDVVINRTLVYGALTAILAVIYVGLVFVFQRALRPLTAESDLAIAGSTLAVAALFRPMRARVQGFIDRRFYRSRYDAQRTLEGFTERLRDEIDLDALAGELVGVAGRTVHPAHASLWLRAPEEPAR